MTYDDRELETLAREVGDRLRRAGLRLAVAESCTGGWLGKALTDIAGSSQWFERGFIVYSNKSKQDLLGVPAAVLLQHGAVSRETVYEMAEGVLRHSPADVTVAVTGIAGPDGGTPDKPVGTVWFAWLRRGGRPETRVCRFEGDREQVRRAAVAQALIGLIDLVSR
ncbi:MAG TPA: CinA family protein [Gammaproteobacteria bacterium]|nr:CinA family protein [Gammaproteobacteria bacterium]